MEMTYELALSEKVSCERELMASSWQTKLGLEADVGVEEEEKVRKVRADSSGRGREILLVGQMNALDRRKLACVGNPTNGSGGPCRGCFRPNFASLENKVRIDYFGVCSTCALRGRDTLKLRQETSQNS